MSPVGLGNVPITNSQIVNFYIVKERKKPASRKKNNGVGVKNGLEMHLKIKIKFYVDNSMFFKGFWCF